MTQRKFYDEAEVKRLLGDAWKAGYMTGFSPETPRVSGPVVDALLKGARTADPQNEVLEKIARHFDKEAKDNEAGAKDCLGCPQNLDIRLDYERDARTAHRTAEYVRGLKA